MAFETLKLRLGAEPRGILEVKPPKTNNRIEKPINYDQKKSTIKHELLFMTE